MRIAIMLRAYDRPGGIGIYARNIVRSLLEIDDQNHYFLLHSNPAHIGVYAHKSNVDEIHIPAGNPVLWDQWLVPRRLRKLGVDLLLNTKFSVPILGKYKKMMVLHGAGWYVHPELYGRFDIFYVRLMMPIYCRLADFLISNSDLTTRDHIETLNISPDKVRTVNLAAGREFAPIVDPQRLAEVQKKYELPQRFVLTVSSYDPRKNIGTLIDAYESCREDIDCKLVIVGKDCYKYREDTRLGERGLADHIVFPDWIEQSDLPAIYSLAQAFAFPSVYEEFGIPVVEAMSCGCPIAAASTGAIPHLVDGAALLCDPFDANALADNLRKLITDDELRRRLVEKGLERSRQFSWSKAAAETLEIMRQVVAQ